MPFRFNGLYQIGVVLFIFNIVLFVFISIMMGARYHLYPQAFKNSFVHPTESLFVPSAVISVGTILINITQYGLEMRKTGDWLEGTMTILYWMYCGAAVVFSSGIYLVLSVFPFAGGCNASEGS